MNGPSKSSGQLLQQSSIDDDGADETGDTHHQSASEGEFNWLTDGDELGKAETATPDAERTIKADGFYWKKAAIDKTNRLTSSVSTIVNDGIPETAVTSFELDRLRDRIPLAVGCFSFAALVLALPLPVVGGSGFGTLNTMPLVFLAFVGYYVGRPLLAAYRHLTLDYEQFDTLPSMTVSLPAYNESNTVRETIDGIFSQQYPGPLEVVVCDDGSTDDTWEILTALSEEYEGLTIVQQENAGSAAARNTALKHGTHDIVVSMDTDTVLKDNALYEAGVSFKRHPEVVAVGTNIGVLNKGETIWTKMQVYNYLLAMEITRMFQSQLGFVLVLSGGCSVFKRDVLEEIGGWNTSQLLADDTDITVRVHEHGPVTYNPNIHAFTEVPSSFRGLWKQRLRWRQHGVTALLHHYRKQLNPSYGRFGVIGLPFRAAVLGLILAQMGAFIATFVSNQASVSAASLTLLLSVSVISVALASISVGTVVMVARDRTVLDHPSLAILYLLLYRLFHITVRFTGTVLGFYSFYLHWRYRQKREIPLPL